MLDLANLTSFLSSFPFQQEEISKVCSLQTRVVKYLREYFGGGVEAAVGADKTNNTCGKSNMGRFSACRVGGSLDLPILGKQRGQRKGN